LNSLSKFSQKIKNVGLTLIFLSLIFYFTYHAINGDRGVLAFLRLSGEVEKAQTDLEQIRAERLGLEHKVNLLRSESLDLDLLESQAKSTLGLAKKNELILFEKEK
jgi:cell division protein FtsB